MNTITASFSSGFAVSEIKLNFCHGLVIDFDFVQNVTYLEQKRLRTNSPRRQMSVLPDPHSERIRYHIRMHREYLSKSLVVVVANISI